MDNSKNLFLLEIAKKGISRVLMEKTGQKDEYFIFQNKEKNFEKFSKKNSELHEKLKRHLAQKMPFILKKIDELQVF